MANDLTNWICNIYIEVRHVSMEELGADESILRVCKINNISRKEYVI